jgi:CRP-like cAMP-binding protein
VFARCSKKELEAVAKLGTSIKVDPGYVLTREGRRGYEFFVILEGEATCSIDGQPVGTMSAGDFFGEVALLDAQRTRSATVVADTAMEVIVIDSREFSGMLGDAPSAARQIMGKLAERLRNAQTTA